MVEPLDRIRPRQQVGIRHGEEDVRPEMGTLDVQRANQLGTEEVRRWMWQRGWDARSDPLVEDRRSDRPPSMARTTGFRNA